MVELPNPFLLKEGEESISITPFNNVHQNGYWIENHLGEGMEIAAEVLIKVLLQFIKENL